MEFGLIASHDPRLRKVVLLGEREGGREGELNPHDLALARGPRVWIRSDHI